MQSKAATVQQYLAELPADRRAALEEVRAVIIKNLDRRGFAEGIQYGMIGYFVPHSVFPAGYHCDPKQPLPFAALASQKNHMSLYLMGTYGGAEEAWLREAWARTGKKLDMGKACIRFKKLEDLPLAVIGEAIKRVPAARFIADYEANLAGAVKPAKASAKKVSAAAAKAGVKKASKAAAKAGVKEASAAAAKAGVKEASKKTAAKKTAAKKTAAKKTAAKKTAAKKTAAKKTAAKRVA